MSEKPKDKATRSSRDDHALSARRNFMLGALAVVPAAAVAASCAVDVDETPEPTEQALVSQAPKPQGDGKGAKCEAADDLRKERSKRRALVDRHMGEENAHDLPGVMATFSTRGEMIFNGMPFQDPASIAAGHVLFGMAQQQGSLNDTQVVPEREYYTDDSVLIEGRVIGTHVGDIMGFAPTGKRVSLPYSAIYRFDSAGKLVSERIVMNWLPLATG